MPIVRLVLAALVALPLISYAQTSGSEAWKDVTTSDGSAATARHESGSVAVNGKLYLLGGRGDRPIEVYDPAMGTWRNLGPMPDELHHFQPVAVGTRLFVLGAFTCCYPDEASVSTIHVFDTQTETWSTAGSLPGDRLRGSAGVVVRHGKIYLAGGNTQGHSGGAVKWFDEYNPVSGEWTKLPDAPNARDHFNLVIADGKLVATAGRATSQPNPFANPVSSVDIYNFDSNQWSDGG